MNANIEASKNKIVLLLFCGITQQFTNKTEQSIQSTKENEKCTNIRK